MPDYFVNVLILCGIVLSYMTGWWLWSVSKRDASWADVAWGIGFVVVVATALVLSQSVSLVKLGALGAVSLWGTRLAGYITLRKRGKGEDKRYAAWREAWGKWATWRSLLQVFWLQGVLLLVIAVPMIWLQLQPIVRPATLLTWTGFAVWLFGWVFEVVGDCQLWQFKRQAHNHGRVMDQGLWRYTRHPNYFGESTLWWGLWLTALSVGAPWWTIMGPITITFLLLRVSGVTLLEAHYQGKPEYQEYQRRTSPFIPWWPRKGVK